MTATTPCSIRLADAACTSSQTKCGRRCRQGWVEEEEAAADDNKDAPDGAPREPDVSTARKKPGAAANSQARRLSQKAPDKIGPWADEHAGRSPDCHRVVTWRRVQADHLQEVQVELADVARLAKR